MWYTITCHECRRKFTTFADHDEVAVKALYSILEKHEASYRHTASILEKSEYEVENWIRHNFVRSTQRDHSAYEY